MKMLLRLLLPLFMAGICTACGEGNREEQATGTDPEGVVRQSRDDGTLSSINQVDENGYVHGVKVNYYEDGTTVHSKVTYEHGRKHGPAIWYFRNGNIYEHTQFYIGRRNGVTRKYYETGELMEEVTYEAGEELPGKKSYDREGNPL